MPTATEILAAACESKIACLENKDLLIVIAEALAQGAGGGGGDIAHAATVLLDHDDIRLLPTTPVELLAPTEIINYSVPAVRVPLPFYLQLDWQNAVADYGNAGGATDYIQVFLGSDIAVGPLTGNLVLGDFVTAASVLGPIMVPAALSAQIQISNTGGMQDNGLYLGVASGGAGNLTGGNAANVARAVVLYRLFNTVTGAFE